MELWKKIKKEMSMKKVFLSIAVLFIVCAATAQNYPEPEFNNEIYYLRKDSTMLVRLEKGTSKMDTKMKMAGFGGAESGYEMEGEKATTRLINGKGLSFIYYTGASAASDARRDSMMRANGADPDLMKSMMDPSNMITLYKASSSREKRKVFLQKSGGMFSGGKNQSSDKYTFSARKIKEGYWELLVDKTLPKGEYVFTMMNMGMGNMDGSSLLFAFGID
jgi:hypothetical protein